MKTDLIEIFQTIRASMQPYAVEGFTVRTNSEAVYDLWSEKNVVVAGKKQNDVNFAGLKINKGYVGVYFMPIYIETEIKSLLHPSLLKLLKGKSCFHIKKLDAELLTYIDAALKVGHTFYKQNEWV